jgi:hypothetical protein
MRVAIDPERFMERLRAGHTPSSIFLGKLPDGFRVRGMSSRSALKAYCAANPEWGRKAMALVEKNAEAANARKGSAKRNRMHCVRGYLLAGDNIYINPRSNYRVCRKCITIWANKLPPPTSQGLRP